MGLRMQPVKTFNKLTRSRLVAVMFCIGLAFGLFSLQHAQTGLSKRSTALQVSQPVVDSAAKPCMKGDFRLVRAMKTEAINHDLSTDAIIAKLSEWDKKYGVTVLEASGNSVKIRLSKLPDDLSELCSEYFMFCPNDFVYTDECANAAAMREFAEHIRETHEVSFWWS